MHLFSQNIAKLIFNLVNPKSANDFVPMMAPGHQDSSAAAAFVPGPYPFAMEDATAEAMINASKKTIPTTFEGAWDNSFGQYRSVDFLDFLLYGVPTIVLPRLMDANAQAAVMTW